jgi:hypothetical protein
LLDGKEVINNR